jgi:hypothetical protein
MDTPSLQDLEDTIISALRSYVAAGLNGTEHLRTAADTAVAAREHFFTAEGEPDWLGRTHAYRVWIREVYSKAGVRPETLTKIQAAVRYHVSAALREKISEEAREDLGLRAETARERSAEKHGRNVEVLSIFGGGGVIADRVVVAKALALMGATLQRIDAGALAHGAEADREEAAAGLAAIASAVKRLQRELKAPH